jgi:chemotaxis protein methyltransferase CheR
MIEHMMINDIREIIKKKTGIILLDDRLLDLDIVLQSRFQKKRMDPQTYRDYLETNYNELIILASNFTIQETYFYRNKSHFDRLKTQILPELRDQKIKNKNKRLLILSAGCATGEEPYTIAMIIYELFTDRNEWDIRIIGTDINYGVLDYAKKGVYSKYKLRNMDTWYIDRFFNTIKEKRSVMYELKPAIKEMVEFRHCNLIREPFELADLNDVDIILCENVIIYFHLESIQRLINNFYNILADKGFLFLGYSETLNLITHKFTLSWWQDSFAYQKISDFGKTTPLKTFSGEKHKQNVKLPTELKDLFTKSYDEILHFLITNYHKYKNEHCMVMLETLESSKLTKDERFFIFKAEYLIKMKDYINAANACRKAVTINPYLIDAHLMLGFIYLMLDMTENAEFELKTSLYINPNSVLGCYFLSRLYKKKGIEKGFKEYLKKSRILLKKNNMNFNTAFFPLDKFTYQHFQNEIINTPLA